MISQIKKNFIIVAMATFAVVLLVLAVGINVWNYSLTNSRLNSTLDNILNFEKMLHAESTVENSEIEAKEYNVQSTHPDFPTEVDPEANQSTRFFTVIYEEKTGIYTVHHDYIHSLDEENCLEYAKEVQKDTAKSGYKHTYCYVKEEVDGITYFVFLNAALELHIMKNLASVSVVVFILSLLCVFILVMCFSGYAVRPFVENMEKQKRFITDASHEMKTPLTSISTSADVLGMLYEEDEWIDNIKKQTRHLSDLVTHLVSLARLDENVPLKDVETFSVSELAWEAVEPFVDMAKAEQKTLLSEIEENLMYTGDQASFEQLCSILLDNAVKYCDPGGRIHFEVKKKYGKINIRIENPCHNHGITDPVRLFDRFYRPDEARNSATGGFGIGLSIAYAIVEKHGGKINASCPDGDHVRFRVVL